MSLVSSAIFINILKSVKLFHYKVVSSYCKVNVKTRYQLEYLLLRLIDNENDDDVTEAK